MEFFGECSLVKLSSHIPLIIGTKIFNSNWFPTLIDAFCFCNGDSRAFPCGRRRKNVRPPNEKRKIKRHFWKNVAVKKNSDWKKTLVIEEKKWWLSEVETTVFFQTVLVFHFVRFSNDKNQSDYKWKYITYNRAPKHCCYVMTNECEYDRRWNEYNHVAEEGEKRWFSAFSERL